jgi:hypothetical protein
MNWFRILIRIWRGDFLNDEIKKSNDVMDEARSAVEDLRATLDGQDDDLFTRQSGWPRRTCDGK